MPKASGPKSAPDLSNKQIVTYQYGPTGRRLSKSVQPNGTGSTNVQRTQYAYLGKEPIMDLAVSGSGDAVWDSSLLYVTGAGVDERLYVETHDMSTVQRRFLLSNHQGSIIAEINADSLAVAGHYSYDPHGKFSASQGAGQPFRFTGRRYDDETGLYYYRERYYDPNGGRFLQTDPIGYEDQMNLYAYVANDPVNRIDPSGRDTIIVNFSDQKISIPDDWGGGTIPQWISNGHSGIVVIREDGLTKYREFGRYGKDENGGPIGKVRYSGFPDLVFDDGVPTKGSLVKLFTKLIAVGQKAGSRDLVLTVNFEADDFDAMMSAVDAVTENPVYSVVGLNCHKFCDLVKAQGLSFWNALLGSLIEEEVELTPENIEQAAEKLRRMYQNRSKRGIAAFNEIWNDDDDDGQ